MKKVQVLMSTYNGADYIAEQIESIFNQVGRDENFLITLLIRDDGSSDDTVNIIKKYSTQYDIKLLIDEKNVGFKNSFLILTKNADKADFYFFADQDDIWEKNKVISFLDVFRTDIPFLVFSDLEMFGSEQGSFYKNGQTNNKSKDFKNILLVDTVTGASSAVNYLAMEAINQSGEILENKINYHDKLIGMIVPFVGEFEYIPEQLTRYRRHDKNVTVQTLGASWFERRSRAFRNPKDAPFIASVKMKLHSLDEFKESFGELGSLQDKERLRFLNRMIAFSHRGYFGQLFTCGEFFKVVTDNRTGKYVYITKIGVAYALIRGSFVRHR